MRQEFDRPKTNMIFTNRYFNIRKYERFRFEGWRYAKNKHLDLSKDSNYSTLEVLPQKMNILKYTNLHEEIPKDIREERFREVNIDLID
jgi:hypothetical protein